MRETRSRTSFGPRRFIGGAAMSTNRTEFCLLTLSVSKFMAPLLDRSWIYLLRSDEMVWAARGVRALPGDSRGFAQRPEGGTNLRREQFRLLPGREVSALVDLIE